MNDFTGKLIEVGDTVAYTRTHYSALYKGRVTKICNKVIRVSMPSRSPYVQATAAAEPRCVIVIEKGASKTPLDTQIDEIISKMSATDRETMRNEPEDDPGGRFHMFGGMAMRNELGLWFNETPLTKWFVEQGVLHGDDRSDIIFKALWSRLNDKPFDIKAEAEHYIEYWREKGCKADGSPLTRIVLPVSQRSFGTRS